MGEVRSLVSPAEAIAYLCFALGWDGGSFPVYLGGGDAPEAWIAQPDAGARLLRRAAVWDGRDSLQVELGVPQDPRVPTPGVTTALWCWIETKDSAWRLARNFRPAPSIVLRIGSSARRLALWALKETISWRDAEAGNRRIAYALRAPQKYAALEALRVPLPGTFIRLGRRSPAPVAVTRFDPLPAFSRSQVVTTLKEPPRPYMERLREGKVSR